MSAMLVLGYVCSLPPTPSLFLTLWEPDNMLIHQSIQANRVLIARKLKGLEDYITMSSVHWHLAEKGT